MTASQPWKKIERQGLCHYPDVSDEHICIVSVETFEDPHWSWNGKEERFRGRTWFMVIFEKPSLWAFRRFSSEPFPTIEEAVRYAEKMVPTGIEWENAESD